MRFFYLIAILCVAGCAQAEINEDAKFTSDTFGSLAEQRTLSNIALLAKEPWATPAYVSLSTGQIQATHTAGFNFSIPLTPAFTGATRSLASDQFNMTPVQTADEAIYDTTFVQDPDDLRRLRALLWYALCPNSKQLTDEWIKAAGQNPINKDVFAAFNAAEKERDAQRPPENPSKNKLLKKLNKLLSDAGKPNGNVDTKAVADVVAHIAGAKGSGGGGNNGSAPSINTDTIENEEYHLSEIVDAITPSVNWVWIGRDDGTATSLCAIPPFFKPPSAVYVGTYRGVRLYADPDKLAKFLILVNYAVPNTIGTTYLTDKALVGQGAPKPLIVRANQ